MRSQGQAAGSQLVDSLNGLVEELIRENRRLQKQVEKLSAGGAGNAAVGFERGLRAIQKRIEKTLAGSVGKPGRGVRSTVKKSRVTKQTGPAAGSRSAIRSEQPPA